MKAISLFSGVGGFDLGFARAGIETVLQVEQDEHCLGVLERHWPDVERITDVRDVGISLAGGNGRYHAFGNAGSAERDTNTGIDLIYGGFPCQDVSVAGKRAGLGGERSSLWFEFERIVSELRPRWVVIENVPGLLSSNSGRDFAVILAGLDELGFDAAWAILDSQHFGVPQRRRRVFIVGGPRGRGAEQVLSLCESCGGNPETGRPPRQDVAYTLAASVRGTGDGHGNVWNSNYVANPLGAHHGRQDLDHDTYVADTLRSHPFPGSDSLGAIVPTLGTSHGADNLAHALTASAGHHGHSSPRGDGSDNLVAQTLMARDAKGPLPEKGVGNADSVPEGVRRLTPLECERLQGFPDGWTEGIADSHRYRMMGNAVTVPVAEWIGHRLMQLR